MHAGWACVVLSAVFLYLSKVAGPDQPNPNDVVWAVSLMMARLCGMSSFAIGAVAIYNHRWTQGVLMMLSSVVLPGIAFLVHGTI